MNAHDEYVSDGGCPSINLHKAWCNERAGHRGPHRAPLLLPPPSTKVRSVKWDDAGRFLSTEESNQ
jgi:hypothetical protein